MKGIIEFLVMFLLIVTAAFMYLGCSIKGKTALDPVAFTELIVSKDTMAVTSRSRKLKNINADPPRPYVDEEEYAHLEDYGSIDPVPSWEASIRHGPIQHEAPLIPYVIPQPAPPPSQPKYDSWYP